MSPLTLIVWNLHTNTDFMWRFCHCDTLYLHLIWGDPFVTSIPSDWLLVLVTKCDPIVTLVLGVPLTPICLWVACIYVQMWPNCHKVLGVPLTPVCLFTPYLRWPTCHLYSCWLAFSFYDQMRPNCHISFRCPLNTYMSLSCLYLCPNVTQLSQSFRCPLNTCMSMNCMFLKELLRLALYSTKFTVRYKIYPPFLEFYPI